MASARGQPVDPTRPELLERVASGLVWKIASQGLAQALSMVSVVVLARLLSPRQFGIAAMAEVASAFVISYADAGLGLALVRKEAITEADRSTVFWASCTLGAAMAGICVALAPLAASFYHTPSVKPLLDVLSLSFFFTGLGSTHRSLQLRSMNFRVLEIRIMASGVAGAAVTIALAGAGDGPWAIIIGDVTGAAISTTLLLALGGWRPKLVFRWSSLRELAPFGLRFVGGVTFQALNTNVDNVLVGRVLGQAALGVYSLAYSVILVPLSRLAAPAHQLLSPAFARMQDDARGLAAGWIRATRLMLLVFLPLMLTIAAVAPDLVHLLFGRRWDAAVPVIRVLAPVCALLSLQGVADVALQAVGRMRTFLRMNALSFALNMVGFLIGVRFGLVAMALALAISTLVFMAVYLTAVARLLKIPVAALPFAVGGVALAAGALLICELAVYDLCRSASVPWSLQMLATVFAGLVAFLLVCALRARDALTDALRLLAQRFALAGRMIPQSLTPPPSRTHPHEHSIPQTP
jgi:O-antigen/teichoic acid export membrane protein